MHEPPAVRTPQASPSGLAVLGVATSLAMLAGWNTSDIGPVADPLAAGYGVGLFSIGLLITALLLVHSLAQIPSGGWTDRLGPRRAGLLAVGILVLGNLVLAAVPNFTVALVTRALMGTGTALAFLAGSSFVRLAGNSSLAQGWVGGMGIGGGGLAIAIVPRVEPLLGWRAPYAAAVGVAVVTLGTLGVAPFTRPVADLGAGAIRSLPSLGSPVLYRLAIIHAGSMGVGVIASSWAVPFLTRKGYGIEQAGTAASLILLAGIVSRPVGGWLERLRPERIGVLVVSSVVAAAIGMVLLVGPFGLSAPLLGSALLGLATGLPFGMVFNEAAVARPDRPSMAVGLVNMFANCAVVVGTPLLGLAFLAPQGAGFGFLALAALGLLSALALPGLTVSSRRGGQAPPV